jgi:molecular chaperone GrpE
MEEQQQQDFEKLQKERDEYLDGWKRAKADFVNYKKDEMARIEGILKLSNEQLIRDLIPVLDSFDLALDSLGEDKKMERGVYLIRSQFEDVLKKYGLERVAVTIGEEFNPAVHDAVASVESEHPPGSVVEEVERGYKLGNKVIRAARVKVAK